MTARFEGRQFAAIGCHQLKEVDVASDPPDGLYPKRQKIAMLDRFSLCKCA
ncbi:MAG: hypothetical protein RLZZ596_1473 [Pseudomonadota bacterium]